MAQRVTKSQIESVLAKIAQTEKIARFTLQVGDDALSKYVERGLLDLPITVDGDASTLGQQLKAWLRTQALATESTLCQMIGDMYADCLETLGACGLAPASKTTPQLTTESERSELIARLVELRDLFEAVAPLHAAFTEVAD